MTKWYEEDYKHKTPIEVSREREKLLEEVKAGTLEYLKKDQGDKYIEPISFQPVESPGIYEAEFALKDGDIIFHFWPHGYHEADERGKVLPRFKKEFLANITKVMEDEFTKNRLEIKHDKDMGAYFVRAIGWGSSQFWRDLAIKACELVHASMGGKS